MIAAVNGHALGVGLTLALQCDIRIFATDATYGVVQVRRGVMGDGYSHWTLPRLVGMSAAAEILLTGRTFDGHRALALGICSQTVPAEEVLPAAVHLARDVAANAAPLSVAVSKQLLWSSWDRSADEVERLETELHHVLMAGPDAREGVESFLEKRPPRWRARCPGTCPPIPVRRGRPPPAVSLDAVAARARIWDSSEPGRPRCPDTCLRCPATSHGGASWNRTSDLSIISAAL